MNILQIGCHHGNDEVFKFIENNKNLIKKIILIDANQKSLELARSTYKNIENVEFFNYAVLPIDIGKTKINLYLPAEDETSAWTCINSEFVSAHAHHNNLVSIESPTISLSKLLINHSDTTNLFIDTEGLDVLNLFSVNFDQFPSLKEVTFEFIHSDGIVRSGNRLNALLMYLARFGFSFSEEGYNIIAIRS
jgi:hypothetical protein